MFIPPSTDEVLFMDKTMRPNGPKQIIPCKKIFREKDMVYYVNHCLIILHNSRKQKPCRKMGVERTSGGEVESKKEICLTFENL